MNSFDQIETLWKQTVLQPISVPTPADVIAHAKKQSGQLQKAIMRQAVAMLLLFPVFIVLVWAINFQYVSSYAAIALMFICVVAYSILRLRQARFLSTIDLSQPPAALLQAFQDFYEKQRWLNGKGLVWYGLVLNVSFGLFFYETVYKAVLMPIGFRWAIIAAYFAWMVVYYFLSKKYVRKEHAKTSFIIDRLREITNTLQNAV